MMSDPIANVDRADAVALFGGSSVRMLLNIGNNFDAGKKHSMLLRKKLRSYMTIVSDGVWQELTGKPLPAHVAIQISVAGEVPQAVMQKIDAVAKKVVESDDRIEIEFV